MMKKAILSVLLLVGVFVSCPAQTWFELGTGIHALNGPSTITCMKVAPSGNVYTSSTFWGDGTHAYIFKWDGTTWSLLGDSSSNAIGAYYGGVTRIAIDEDENVYAAGSAIVNAEGKRYVAKWDGTHWSELGTLDVTGSIGSLEVSKSGNLYAGGSLKNTDGKYCLLKWDGAAWSQVGNASDTLYGVSRMAVDSHDHIYIECSVPSGPAHFYVAKWDGTSWTEPGKGTDPLNPNAGISALVLDADDNLYATGLFTNGPTYQSGQKYVAKWDGTNWTEIGPGKQMSENELNEIEYMAVDADGYLYAAGWFLDENDDYTVIKWNGTDWVKVGTGSDALKADYVIYNIAFDGEGNLYASGGFRNANNKTYIAKYGTPPVITAAQADKSKSTVNAYPNPSSGRVNLSLSEPVNAFLYDYSGKLLGEFNLTEGEAVLELNTIPQGIYTLLLKGESNNYSPLKIVKE